MFFFEIATTTLQMNKLKDSGLVDKLDKNRLMDQIKTMNANAVLAKVVQSDRFKELKSPSLLFTPVPQRQLTCVCRGSRQEGWEKIQRQTVQWCVISSC
jgi:hypothetical protein